MATLVTSSETLADSPHAASEDTEAKRDGELVARTQGPWHHSRPLSTFYPSVLNHRGGEMRQNRGNQTRAVVRIPATWRKKPTCDSTQGGLLSGGHKNLESSSTRRQGGTGSSQWDASVPPGWQMPGGLQLFWDASSGRSLTAATPQPPLPQGGGVTPTLSPAPPPPPPRRV